MQSDVSNWLEKQMQPVIILHHETPASYHYIQRSMLSTNSTSNSTVPIRTEFQISQYQVQPYFTYTTIPFNPHVYVFACGQEL